MIKVLSTGLQASIQDMGRYGFRHLGVPCSGVMDRKAALLANQLIGNDFNAPLLEFGYQGPVLEFLEDTEIAITGAGFCPSVFQKESFLNNRTVIKKGSILRFGTPSYGVWAYLAVQGGFFVDQVLGSSSYHPAVNPVPSVQKGKFLKLKKIKATFIQKHVALRVSTNYFEEDSLQVYKGPEFENLDLQSQEALLTTRFTVSSQSNRMAVVLNYNPQIVTDEIITAPVQPGTVQLTPSGKLIVLMRDCQTTGGYARIFQLSETCISVLSQKRAGQQVQFKLI